MRSRPAAVLRSAILLGVIAPCILGACLERPAWAAPPAVTGDGGTRDGGPRDGGTHVTASCTGWLRDCNALATDGCETDTSADVRHCGACGRVCPVVADGVAGCRGGTCVVAACRGGHGDCNDSITDGCEARLDEDPRHCGACARACSDGTDGACVAGRCIGAPSAIGNDAPSQGVLKWIVFAIALAGVFPLSRRARRSPRLLRLLSVALGFAPFLDISINLLSHETYRGDSRGFEITLADLIALALWLALPRPRDPAPPAYRIPRWSYLAVATFSVALAPMPLFAAFSVWKIFRMYRLGATVERAARTAGLGPEVLRGLSLGVIYSLLVALQQRYLMHHFQVSGPFEHQNLLAMVANMVYPASAALVLARQGGRTALVTVGAAVVAVVMSLSRGGMIMCVLAGTMVYVVSFARQPSLRKLALLGIALLGAAVVLARSWDTIAERFLHAPKASEQARVVFKEASRRMLADHPLGIGINQYSYVLANEGYADRLDIDPGDRSGIVHHIYWLTAAELGYLGLAAFLALLGAPLVRAIRGAWRLRRDVRGEVLVGLAAGLVVTYLQGTLEWSLRITAVAQVLWIVFGLIAALGAVESQGRRPDRLTRPVPS